MRVIEHVMAYQVSLSAEYIQWEWQIKPALRATVIRQHPLVSGCGSFTYNVISGRTPG